ncbi:MAG: NUDIX domain-containing protein [Patescibacteria group bacterium]
MANIVYVDEHDNVIGAGPRREALEKGITHRVARIFLFNKKGEVLMQKRAEHLLSLPGRWDQSAAGHVDEGESYLQAAEREMREEIGLSNIPLALVGKFFYTEEIDEPLVKKRFNTLYTAKYDGEIHFNTDEVSEVRWIPPAQLKQLMEAKPSDFTQGSIESFKYLSEQSATEFLAA